MKISKVQQIVSGLNRSWGRPCLFVAAFLLAGVGEATVATVQGGEEDDIKALRQLENDIAQAWVRGTPRLSTEFWPAITHSLGQVMF